jgi:hypothetical protein
MNRELPQLDQISVASPCHEPWDHMQGDERARFCGQCRKHVYNFAEMTRPEIEALIIAKEGKFCARFYRRPDGTLLTRDCPVGIRDLRQRLWRAAVGIAATVAAVTAGLWWGRVVRGDSEESDGRTGIQLVDNGPVSRLAGWVNPQQFTAGFVCFPLPQILEQIDSPAGESTSHSN